MATTATDAAGPARPGGGRAPGRIEYTAILATLAMYSAAITPLIRAAGGAGRLMPGDSDPGSTAFQLAALLVVLAWLAANRHRLPAQLAGLGGYATVAALCFASVLWSAFPLITLRKGVTLSVCILYGAYLHDRLGLDGLVRTFLRLSVVLALLSLAVYVAAPGLGRDAAQGYGLALRGVFAVKNSAGMAMLLGIACALRLGALPGARRRRCLTALLLLLATLVLTRSASSLVVAAATVGLGVRFWLRTPAARLLHAAALAALALVALFSLLFWPDAAFALLGRDASFTGRIPLWNEAFKLIAARPVLGYGYAAFWSADSRDVRYLWRILAWEAPNAHDGYVDLLLQLGIAGLALYAAMWARIVFAALRARRRALPTANWILLFMFVNVVLNIDEGPLTYPDEFTLFVAACAAELGQGGAAART